MSVATTQIYALRNFSPLVSESGPLIAFSIIAACIVTVTILVAIDRLSGTRRRKPTPLKHLALGSIIVSPLLGILLVAPLATIVNAQVGAQTPLTMSGPVVEKHFGRSPSFALRDRTTGEQVSFGASHEEVRALQIEEIVTRSFWQGSLGVYYVRNR